MTTLSTGDPMAVAVVGAIHTGSLTTLARLLGEHPGLATVRLGGDGPERMARTLLHVATDWPGHFPEGPATVAMLVAAGADVNARFRGPHGETPLHWAASSDDVAVLDALLDAGANIESSGAVIAGGTALADATAFGQWGAAYRLVERGAQTNSFAAASLGLMDRLQDYFSGSTRLTPEEVSDAFWAACHRRPATRRRVPARPGRHPELATRLGTADALGRRRTRWSDRGHYLAERSRREDGHRSPRRLNDGAPLFEAASRCPVADPPTARGGRRARAQAVR